jgi:hypothetical protein
MLTLPKKQMALRQILPAIFLCWKSMILLLLPLSFLCVLLTSLPKVGEHLHFIQPGHISFFIAMALSYAIYLIPSGAIIARLHYSLHGKLLTNVDALKISLSRFFKMLATGIILLLAMYILLRFGLLFSYIHKGLGLGFAFLFILVVSPYLIPASPLVIIDNLLPHKAIVGGCRLVNKNWLYVFCTIVVVSTVTLLLNIVANQLGQIAVFILSLFTLPLTLSMTVLVTENLKLGK